VKRKVLRWCLKLSNDGEYLIGRGISKPNVPKKPVADSTDLSNYWPVSNLNNISKILELLFVPYNNLYIIPYNNLFLLTKLDVQCRSAV